MFSDDNALISDDPPVEKDVEDKEGEEERELRRGGLGQGKGKREIHDGDDSAAGGLFYFISAGVELAVTDIPSTSHC
jgi:hypothetical protein